MAEPVPAREQVMAAIEALLKTLTGIRVERNLDEPLPSTLLPAILLLDGDHTRESLSPYEDRYLMTFSLVFQVRGSGGYIPGSSISNLWARVVSLFSNNPTANGLVRQIEEISLTMEESDRDEGGVPIGGATHQWQAEFYTPHGDPFTLLTP